MQENCASFMENAASSILTYCSSIDFGKVALAREEKSFYGLLNDGILRIIKSLPSSMQTDALLCLTNHLKLPIKKDIEFFAGFYPPTWSILYWLWRSFSNQKIFPPNEMRIYCSVHAAAMLLHLLDDHLTDGEMQVTHLALLIRSQLWLFLNRALADLSNKKNNNSPIINKYIDGYYASIESTARQHSLNSYCMHFKKQMGLGYIAPILLAKRMTGNDRLATAVEGLFGAFGTAWRLLDDLHDISDDLVRGAKSSIYCCLPESIKQCWDCSKRTKTGNQKTTAYIVAAIFETDIIEQVISRICHELELAATMADLNYIRGYADEIRLIAKPIRNTSLNDIKYEKYNEPMCRGCTTEY